MFFLESLATPWLGDAEWNRGKFLLDLGGRQAYYWRASRFTSSFVSDVNWLGQAPVAQVISIV